MYIHSNINTMKLPIIEAPELPAIQEIDDMFETLFHADDSDDIYVSEILINR